MQLQIWLEERYLSRSNLVRFINQIGTYGKIISGITWQSSGQPGPGHYVMQCLEKIFLC